MTSTSIVTPTTTAIIPVTIEVPADHPHLVLKGELDWVHIEDTLKEHWQKAGKNVECKGGRPFDLAFYARVIVLMLLLKLSSRQMERELRENAVARLFVQVEDPCEGLVRDHSNIERTYRALGVNGVRELNNLLLNKAVQEGFADLSKLSADTTCQEAAIGYPNEPGILRQVARGLKRVFEELAKRGVAIGKEAFARVEQVLRSVKESHLFCKTKEDKNQVLERLLVEGQEMMESVAALEQQCAPFSNGMPFRGMVDRLRRLRGFFADLGPQIQHWLDTGKVAPHKLLHPTLQEARSIVRNKAGKKWEFGYKWLICWIGGGYAYGRMMLDTIDEYQMPLLAVGEHQLIFGEENVPEWYVHDRGGWSKKVVKQLQELNIQKVGIQPKGRAAWLVGESDRDTVRSLRAQTEGIIGTLKQERYGFNRPKTRSTTTTEMAGMRAFVSKNLNKLISDLLGRKKQD